MKYNFKYGNALRVLFIIFLSIDSSRADSPKPVGSCEFRPGRLRKCFEYYAIANDAKKTLKDWCQKNASMKWYEGDFCPKENRIAQCEKLSGELLIYYEGYWLTKETPISDTLAEAKHDCYEPYKFTNLTQYKVKEPEIPDSVKAYKKNLELAKSKKISIEELYVSGEKASNDLLDYVDRKNIPYEKQKEFSDLHTPGFLAYIGASMKSIPNHDYFINFAVKYGQKYDVDFFKMEKKIVTESSELIFIEMVSDDQYTVNYGDGNLAKFLEEVCRYQKSWPKHYEPVINTDMKAFTEQVAWGAISSRLERGDDGSFGTGPEGVESAMKSILKVSCNKDVSKTAQENIEKLKKFRQQIK